MERIRALIRGGGGREAFQDTAIVDGQKVRRDFGPTQKVRPGSILDGRPGFSTDESPSPTATEAAQVRNVYNYMQNSRYVGPDAASQRERIRNGETRRD